MKPRIRVYDPTAASGSSRFLCHLKTAVCVCIAALAAAATAGEPVVLRAVSGKFLRAAEGGAIKADQPIPTVAETFSLEPLPSGRIALKAHDGRYLIASDPAGRTLRYDSPRARPGERETFEVVAAEGHRLGLKVAGFREFVALDPAAPAGSGPAAPGRPLPAETLEIYRVAPVPEAIQGVLVMLAKGAIHEELHEKQYDQTRTRKIEKYIELPSPALNNLKHTKRHRVLATEEVQQVKARLDGPPEFKITHMPLLKAYTVAADKQGGTRLALGGGLALFFAADATVPFRGEVHYRVPNLVAGGTGYQATAKIFVLAEVRAKKQGDKFSFTPPEVRQLQVKLDLRDLSNDILNAAREPIEDVVNREIRHNDARIREQANKALAKAVQAQQFQHPLLKYLALP